METRGAGTRHALIETAERLFAERGIEAVSLRDVSAAAGQRNHSATQYHFGDRAGLVAATFEHRMGAVNAARHRVLNTLETEGCHHDPASLVAAFVVPLVDVIAGTTGWYGRFLARARWDTFAVEVLIGLPVLSSYQRVCDHLGQGLVHLSDAHRQARIDQLTNLVVGSISDWEWQRDRDQPRLDAEELTTELISTGTAVIEASTDRSYPLPIIST